MNHVRAYEGTVYSPELLRPEVMNYARTWANCCSSVKGTQTMNLAEELDKQAARFRAKSYEEVRASALAGNEVDVLDVGMRRYTGCGVSKDTTEGMAWWISLTDLTPLGSVKKPSRSTLARAFSCLAYAEFEARVVDDGTTWNIDSLYRAGDYADRCAALGLTTSIVLTVAATIERAGFRRREDEKFPGHNSERFEKLTYLWAAADKRAGEVEKKATKLAIKQGNNPNAYFCAAEGCGIEATSKSGLMRCAGPCARDIKPSYCSKECQRRDWTIHKYVCKATSSPEKGHGEQESNMKDAALASHAAATSKTDGKEHSVRVPDPTDPAKTIQMSSSTMSAALLREVREEITNLVVDNRGGDSNVPPSV